MSLRHEHGQRWCSVHSVPIDDPCPCGSVHGAETVPCDPDCPMSA